MNWVYSAAVSVGQSFILGFAAWAWAAFCAAAIVRMWGHGWGIRVSGRTLAYATSTAVVAVIAATVLIYHLKSFSILGIRGLEVEQPRLHWIWWGLVVLEPVGSAVRFRANRHMWARQATLVGKEYVIDPPRLTEYLMLVVDAVTDWIGG